MTDLLDSATKIYEGVWTDWSKGAIWGLTLTLDPTKAVIITNSLALFVTIAGVELWTILRYTIHQRSASSQKELFSPHIDKQKVILRNAGGSIDTARLMLNLAWTSRRSTGKRAFSSYAVGLLAILYTASFMAASIFSNNAISIGSARHPSPVLIRSKNCGVWNQTYFDLAQSLSAGDPQGIQMFFQACQKRATDIQSSLRYAQQCYPSHLSQLPPNPLTSNCNILKKPSLDWEYHEGSCPFQPQMCHNNSRSIVLDTGDMDSHDDLGINAAPQDRLRYRRLTTCSVLKHHWSC